MGQADSIFYNSFVQNSITLTGQDLITSSIIAIECFLDNNFKFNDLDDFYTYANNILNENYEHNITDYLDQPKTFSEVFDYFKGKFKKDINLNLLENFINSLSIENANRLYWKNNLRLILNEDYFSKKLSHIAEYEYSTEVNKEIESDLEELKSLIIEFCFYNYFFWDKYIRAQKDTRDVICVVDTDSNFINVNGLIHDFMKRENLESIDTVKRMTLVNIFVNISTEALKEIFWKLTGNIGIHEEIRPKINMKNESIRLLYTVMYIANLFNCWNRKKSAAKPQIILRNVQRLSKRQLDANHRCLELSRVEYLIIFEMGGIYIMVKSNIDYDIVWLFTFKMVSRFNRRIS